MIGVKASKLIRIPLLYECTYLQNHSPLSHALKQQWNFFIWPSLVSLSSIKHLKLHFLGRGFQVKNHHCQHSTLGLHKNSYCGETVVPFGRKITVPVSRWLAVRCSEQERSLKEIGPFSKNLFSSSSPGQSETLMINFGGPGSTYFWG